jgi:predicted O-methyltransferase YrrM
MESYVRAEYGNLWETHQMRPHAFGHTWSPGYELPAGMLHGHAVATCMGYGTYLARRRDWISQDDFERILKLISNLELALWHPIMDNHALVQSANKKAHQKRGGNLCAPVPKGMVGFCGYINDLTNDDIPTTMNEYKAIVQKMVRGGLGVEVHCADVGLGDPAAVAGDALVQIGQAPAPQGQDKKEEMPSSYDEWIKAEQARRNTKWEKNVSFTLKEDTPKPDRFDKFTLFEEGAESYAMAHTSLASTNIQNASKVTEDEKMFMPCMVGAMESQFLKMLVQVNGAKRCLDIGTFTGMSALAMAEGLPADGKVVTLECSENVANVAKKVFAASSVADKIELRLGQAVDALKQMVKNGEKFDIIFIDADKENYIEYYELSLQLLGGNGVILADNSLCALLYDQESDVRSSKLHDFNQYVKNDKRTEQVVLTVREGITMIKPV